MEALLSSLVPTLPLFFLLFIAIYLLSYFYIFRNWVGVSRLEVSSCLMSLSHGTPVAIAATFSILQTPFFDFAAPNTALRSVILEYSIAFSPPTSSTACSSFPPTSSTKPTTWRSSTCSSRAGASSATELSPSSSSYSSQRSPAPVATPGDFPAAVFGWCSSVFYSFYSVERGILGPLVVYKMGVFYASGGAVGVIPKWAWISWMVMIGSAIVASILWVSSIWMDFYRQMCRRKEMSLS